MNLVWRFYIDPDHRWKWQRLAFDRTVIAESTRAHKDYEACLVDAHKSGYDFEPSKK